MFSLHSAVLDQEPLKPITQNPCTGGVEEDDVCLIRVLDPSIAASFAVDDGSARQLASLLSHSVTWQPAPGGVAGTSDAVNQVLISILQGMDRCAALPPCYLCICLPLCQAWLKPEQALGMGLLQLVCCCTPQAVQRRFIISAQGVALDLLTRFSHVCRGFEGH